MTTTKSILIVEDEVKLARLVQDYLTNAGYQTHLIHDGLQVIDWVKANLPDLILLDIMLPNRDGLEICREIHRIAQIPVIMVTARVEEIDRLLGLELGADDYICKPFSPRELVARVKAVLRRSAQSENGEKPTPQVVEVDPHRFRVRAADKEIELTTVEFHLFETLYKEPGRIFSRNDLIDKIYNDHRVVSDRTIDSHIKKLRKKLSDLLPERDLIHSVYGAGYRYEPTDVEETNAPM